MNIVRGAADHGSSLARTQDEGPLVRSARTRTPRAAKLAGAPTQTFVVRALVVRRSDPEAGRDDGVRRMARVTSVLDHGVDRGFEEVARPTADPRRDRIREPQAHPV